MDALRADEPIREYRPAEPSTDFIMHDRRPRLREWGEKYDWGWVEIGRKIDGSPVHAAVSVDENDVTEMLLAAAKAKLDPGLRFEIRRKVPENYGRSYGMAWYRTEDFDAAESWGEQPDVPRWIEAGGYYLVGQFVT